MTSYERFAEVYDTLMTDIPYDTYVEWVMRVAPVEQFPMLLDIGCGTGVLTAQLDDMGYQVSGIDVSEEMLVMAQARFRAEERTIPLFALPMEQLEGFDMLDVAMIAIDSLNYVRHKEDVVATFRRIYACLRQGGQLLFDVHSLYKMNEIFMDSPFTYDDGQIAYVWHTEEGEEPHSVYHQMTFFVEQPNGFYERFDEEHYQRTFASEQYEQWLYETGFTTVEITADWINTQPSEQSERIFIRAVK